MKLAIRGASPVRTTPFPAWPIFDGREAAGLQAVLESRNWGGYPCPNDLAREFGRLFAKHHGAGYGVAVTNGTVSLELALQAAGIGYGDEVIVPAYTWEGTLLWGGTGLCRCRSKQLLPRSGGDRGGDHVKNTGDYSSPPWIPFRGHGRDHGDREPPQALRARGLRPRARCKVA